MEIPQPIPPGLVKNNIYALLSLIGGSVATLCNCLTLVSVLVPGLPFLCATISGLFSVGAVVTGAVGLNQVRHSGQKGKKMAVAGLVLGIIGVLSACVIPFVGTAMWAAMGIGLGDSILVPIQ
jgi:hypothetical protein